MKRLLAFISLACLPAAHADPQLTSWFTANSGKYARIYQSTANETAGTTSTTWTRGSGTQSSPVYADVNEVNSSTNWVYIRTSGLASHIMGPWYIDAAKTQNFPNFPSNTATLYRIPRTPVIPTTKTLTGLGATGRMVNGVSMFDSRDAFSYSNANATDATPVNGITGDGIWNRDGYFNEGVTFDPALAHQAGNNYHYHAHPIALRYQLGDHVDYNATTNRYTESAATPTQHSPILAWAADGLPVYGPYGYSSPMNASSGVRRMISGFTKRDGTNGTTAITVRQVLPLWAQRIQNRTTLTASQYGPAVNTTYALGHYIEDFDYRGDLGQTLGTDFDLNEQNVRFCVTPEYPSGTWAYFTPINADGTPQYPYTTGRAYYGDPTGGSTTATVMNTDTPLTQQFIGGANKALTINSANVSGSTVTLTWSAVEGGTYSVDASPNQSTWTSKATGIVSTGISASQSYTALGTTGTEYGRVNRTALATYDANGQTTATVSQSATKSYSLTPNTAPTITSIANQTTTRNTATSALSFTVGDAETAPTSLTVTASSSNTTLVPLANIVITGTGSSRSVVITPALGKSGTATITLIVNDGTTTTSTTFTITVPPPNILVIIADDFGLDASAIYNPSGTVAATPNLASLASGGVRFNKAYTYTVCSPTRSCMLTGRYGARTGTANVVGGASSNNALKSSEFTLPDAFAANSGLNYQLKHIGKWHLGGGNTAPGAIGGWPAFAGSLAGEIDSYYSWPKVITDGTPAGTTTSTSTTYATTDQVNDAVSFITAQNAANKPWFTWVAFNAPHTISPGSGALYQLPPTSLCPDYASLPNTNSDISANPLSYYNAMVQAMDTEIGRLLASVDLNKTDVIFIGDNGTPPATLQSPYPASRGKGTLYEGGTRIPMIMRGPDIVSPGRQSDALTHTVDLYSTILELAGIDVAATTAGVTLDSQSLLPVLQNQASTRTNVFGDYWDLAFPTLTDAGRTIRDSQYKLVRLTNNTERFYDLSADPYEATNLIAGGYASMNTTRQAAYTSLSNQLATYNTPPTISSIANQSVAVGTPTNALAFTIGDAELNTSILSVTATSSNTTVVPSANVVIGGSGTSRTVTVTPASGQTGTSTVTLSVTDGIFTTNTSFTVTAGSITAVGAPSIAPTAPTNTDPVTVTASVSAAAGRTISGVQLAYNTGAQVTAPVFQEIFSSGSTTSGLTGSLKPWTVTANRNAADVKQRSGTGNHTVPIVVANCTTNGTTTVTCSSTTGLIAGMLISGTNITAGTTISQVNDATTFTITPAASGSGSGLSLTAAGVTLTGCSVTGGTTINCATTTGLVVGMGISGVGLVTNPPNTPPVVATVSGTSFTVTVGAGGTVTTCPTTLTASGCGLDFTNGTTTYTDTMATTTNAIAAQSATAGNVEFYVRTSDLVSNHGWTFQVSPDGGTTWNTRLSESFSSGQLSACTLNAGNDQTNGSGTISCSNTTGLAVGMSVQGAAVQIANCITSTTTNPNVILTANTGSLAVGMYVNGSPTSGIPQNSRITAINPGVSFTINNNVTVTNASPGINLNANYIAPNATITAVGASSFTVNPVAFYSGTVSLVNHSFMLKHYDLLPGELTANLKMRFQWSGSTAVAPARTPTCDIDDIVVSLSTGAAPGSLTMFDDGAHGDGAAGDGIYGVTIPAQAAATTVSYTITATDSAAGTATNTGSYTVQTAAPVLAVTPSTTLSAAGAAGGGSFTPSSLTYTLTNSGTGTMSWTASKTQSWVTLSSASGTLAAGATTTVTASINTANANSLSAGSYSDTITFTNATNANGSTTRGVALLVTNGTPTIPNPPVLTLSAYSAGTSKTVFWPGVANATSYTIQIATNSTFTTNLVSQTVTTPYASFEGLVDGVTYYYRVLATNGLGSSAYSATASSTQDSVAPTVAITSPSSGNSTSTNTVTVTGTASDTRSGISGVKVNNVAATSSDNFATWTASIPLGFGTNAITATATDGAGNLATSSAVTITMTTAQTYNPLIIPDPMNGTTFNLHLYQTNKRFPTWTTSNPTLGLNSSTTLGPAPGTTTLGYNGALMWGPTLIMNKGDTVQMNVTNHLDQSNSTLLRSTTTTVHWHGFHIPAIMDGGPRQVVAGGSTWSPAFEIKNDAATYWYHPHLHMATQEQLTLGAGGFIIVRDPLETSLNLPRTYGVDDIPLAVTTRRLLSGNNEFSANQYVQSDGSTSTTDNYGDYVLVNGTMNPQVSLPQQYVRLRILCADIQRGYRFGFSDNRNFYVIANDQGLLNTPQLVSQVTMMIGERVEILVNLGGDAIGSAIDLMAYDNLGTAGALNGSLGGFGGSESNSRTPNGASGPENGGLLCNSDFRVLRINVASATASPVTSVPSTLANNTYWTNADATTTRTINISNGNGGTPGFTFDGISYSPTINNFNIPLNAIEKWTFNGGQVFGHSIHIHDIRFKIVSRSVTQSGANTNQIFDTVNGTATLIGSKACANYESGWKDTLYVPRGETVSVIAKYDDYASPANPYMLHCHMLNHEDGGLMGQFIVTSAATETIAAASATRSGTDSTINFQFNATVGTSFLVQYSPDMTTGSWVTVGVATSDGSSASFLESDPSRLAQARGFYRAVVQSVVAPPVITSSATATATRGAAFTYQITATNSPTGYSAILQSGTTAVPGGLSVNPATGLISGTVPTGTAAGTYNIDVMASNSGGTTHLKVTLTVN